MLFDENQQKRRKIMILSFTFLIMLISRYFMGSIPKFLLNICIILTYFIILLLPFSWWTRTKMIIATLVLVIETVMGIYWFHEINLIYIIYLISLYISVQWSVSKSLISLITVLPLTVILYIQFGKVNIFSVIPFIILTFVLFFTIRIRLQRNEMFQVNKQQLAELQTAYEQLQEASVTSMRYAVLEERTRIAREIHDAVGHSLTSLIVQMQALKFMKKENPIKTENSIEEMLAVARQGLKDIRHSVHSLADNEVYSGIAPLKALLSRMKEYSSIQYEFHSDFSDEELNPSISGLLFKVLQETITNIVRHSKATLVNVFLKKELDKVVLCIRDNGLLNSDDPINEGFGLKAMKARLEDAGGKMKYLILEPNGLEIVAEIALNYGKKKD